MSKKELEIASEDAPVVKMVNLILSAAIKKGASSIRLGDHPQVDYCLTGQWTRVMNPPKGLWVVIKNRVRIMADIDIIEKPEKEQEGEITLKTGKGIEHHFSVKSTQNEVIITIDPPSE